MTMFVHSAGGRVNISKVNISISSGTPSLLMQPQMQPYEYTKKRGESYFATYFSIKIDFRHILKFKVYLGLVGGF